MIQSVEKSYLNGAFSNNYNVTYDDGTKKSVPHDTANRHYQEILEWVENGGTIIDNGGA